MLRYFGPPRAVSVRPGCRRPDEAEDVPVVDDQEHHAVAEPVDETAGAGDGGPGDDHLLPGDSAAAQMINQSGPAVRRLAGSEAQVVDQIQVEPAYEICLSPRR